MLSPTYYNIPQATTISGTNTNAIPHKLPSANSISASSTVMPQGLSPGIHKEALVTLMTVEDIFTNAN